jgi:outer membrane protein assembly factor BamB
MRRVDKTLRDLVSISPFTSGDGSVFVASKASRIITVDALTGALQQQFSLTPDLDHTAAPDAMPRPANGSVSILVGRTEYTVLCYNRTDGALRWNMTYAEYAHTQRPWDSLAKDGLSYYSTQVCLFMCVCVCV